MTRLWTTQAGGQPVGGVGHVCALPPHGAPGVSAFAHMNSFSRFHGGSKRMHTRWPRSGAAPCQPVCRGRRLSARVADCRMGEAPPTPVTGGAMIAPSSNPKFPGHSAGSPKDGGPRTGLEKQRTADHVTLCSGFNPAYQGVGRWSARQDSPIDRRCPRFQIKEDNPDTEVLPCH